MKANEFVKKYGLDTFRLSMGFVSTRKYLVVYEDEIDFADEIKPSHGECVFDRSEVKRLVEAHEIIKLFKSLDHAKAEAQACENSKHSEILVKLDVGVGYIWLSRVKQAITDVESCQ